MVVFTILGIASMALADGGTVRAAKAVDGWQITVLADPTPMRAGKADVSVMVQNEAGEPIMDDLHVVVSTSRPERHAPLMRSIATRQASKNKLYLSAVVDLPAMGEWNFAVEASERMPGSKVRRLEFTETVGAPMAKWEEFWQWIFIPLPIILLFVIRAKAKARRAKARGIDQGTRVHKMS